MRKKLLVFVPLVFCFVHPFIYSVSQSLTHSPVSSRACHFSCAEWWWWVAVGGDGDGVAIVVARDCVLVVVFVVLHHFIRKSFKSLIFVTPHVFFLFLSSLPQFWVAATAPQLGGAWGCFWLVLDEDDVEDDDVCCFLLPVILPFFPLPFLVNLCSFSTCHVLVTRGRLLFLISLLLVWTLLQWRSFLVCVGILNRTRWGTFS